MLDFKIQFTNKAPYRIACQPQVPKTVIVMILSKFKLRALMLNHKLYLGDLYTSNSMTAKKILNNSLDVQLKLLLNLLYRLANGDLPMTRKTLQKLQHSRKASFLHTKFSSKTSVNALLKSSRQEILVILRKFAPFFCDFFFHIFNEH